MNKVVGYRWILEWKFGDIVKPNDDRMYPNERYMYVGPGDLPATFRAVCVREDPDNDGPLGVRQLGGYYTNWSRRAFEKVDG